MKKFIQNNTGAIIACMMLSGMLILGIGLDWAQSQIAWRGNIAWLPISLGSVLFAGACIWLANK